VKVRAHLTRVRRARADVVADDTEYSFAGIETRQGFFVTLYGESTDSGPGSRCQRRGRET
jgi:hypothetical protein